jgi:hypothetical protein
MDIQKEVLVLIKEVRWLSLRITTIDKILKKEVKKIIANNINSIETQLKKLI